MTNIYPKYLQMGCYFNFANAFTGYNSREQK